MPAQRPSLRHWPRSSIRLTASNRDAWVSDRYRLRDFQCKLDGKNKFLFLRPEALLKLELMQDEMFQYVGKRFGRFTIMSGYRTPYYNALIGNEETAEAVRASGVDAVIVGNAA